jgi:uncharacterized delta-60 repeat protein
MQARPSALRLSAPRRVAIEPLETRTLMSAWDDAVAPHMNPIAAATLADGSVIVVGSRSGGSPVTELAVARLTPQAQLDTTFGVGGVATVPVDGFHESGNDVLIAPDGKILVSVFVQVHDLSSGDMSDFGVARFNPDGTPDATFGGGDGVVTLNLSDGLAAGADAAYALALDPDGRIVLAGTVNYRDEFSQNTGGFGLARLYDDGSVDTSFGTGGQVSTQLAQPQSTPQCSATDVQILPDGRILASGYRAGSNGLATSARYLPDGTLDASYGVGGILYTDDPYVAPAIAWPALPEAPPPLPVPPAPPAPPPPPATVTATVPPAVSRTQLLKRGKFFKFNITYTSHTATPIDVSTIGAGDLTVAGPAGFVSHAELLRARARLQGTVVKATYRAAAPGGKFDRADNGHYALILASSAVGGAGDPTGTGAATALGAFYVDCSPPPERGMSAGTTAVRVTQALFSDSPVGV